MQVLVFGLSLVCINIWDMKLVWCWIFIKNYYIILLLIKILKVVLATKHFTIAKTITKGIILPLFICFQKSYIFPNTFSLTIKDPNQNWKQSLEISLLFAIYKLSISRLGLNGSRRWMNAWIISINKQLLINSNVVAPRPFSCYI